MASGFLFLDGRDPDNVFTAGNAGITTGLKHASSGTDLGQLYASGNSGINTGLKNASGTDIGSLFSASGTAPSFNGGTYTSPVNLAGSTYSSGLHFQTTSSGWTITNAAAGTTLASGSLPSGCTNVIYTPTVVSSGGSYSSVNQASGSTAVSGSPQYQVSCAHIGSTPGTDSATISLQVQFLNSAGAVITTGTCTLKVQDY